MRRLSAERHESPPKDAGPVPTNSLLLAQLIAFLGQLTFAGMREAFPVLAGHRLGHPQLTCGAGELGSSIRTYEGEDRALGVGDRREPPARALARLLEDLPAQVGDP